MEGTAGETTIITTGRHPVRMLPLAVYRIFSIEMINPNPPPTWRTAFGLSAIGPSGGI